MVRNPVPPLGCEQLFLLGGASPENTVELKLLAPVCAAESPRCAASESDHSWSFQTPGCLGPCHSVNPEILAKLQVHHSLAPPPGSPPTLVLLERFHFLPQTAASHCHVPVKWPHPEAALFPPPVSPTSIFNVCHLFVIIIITYWFVEWLGS